MQLSTMIGASKGVGFALAICDSWLLVRAESWRILLTSQLDMA
jgi:hypothetical protein